MYVPASIVAHKHAVVRYHYPKGIIIITSSSSSSLSYLGEGVFGSNQMELEEAQLVHIDSLFPIFFCVLSERSLALLYCICYVASNCKTQVLSIASKPVHRCAIFDSLSFVDRRDQASNQRRCLQMVCLPASIIQPSYSHLFYEVRLSWSRDTISGHPSDFFSRPHNPIRAAANAMHCLGAQGGVRPLRIVSGQITVTVSQSVQESRAADGEIDSPAMRMSSISSNPP